MIYFLDKLFLFIFALILSLIYYLNDFSLVVISTAIIFTSLFYIADKKFFKIALTIIFAILCIFLPELILFMPLMLYDIIFSKIQFYGLLFVPALIMNLNLNNRIPIFLLLIFILSILSKYKRNVIENLQMKYISYRDSTTEYNNLLKEKNQQLIANQDYELRVATLNERNRISKELHDSIGHLLSRSLIQVGALGVISKEDEVKKGLNELKDSLSAGMDSVRETIHHIRDDSFDVYTKIQEIIEGFTFVPLHFEYNLYSQPPMEVKYCIISTIKESLANIIKHSNATEASITLLEHTSLYQLIVYDNGFIFDRNTIEFCARPSEGREEMGLSSMVERVHNLKGIINITTENGFKIFITIPKN